MGILRTSDAARRRMRAYLVLRDGRGCGRCGDPIDAREVPSLGHIVAVADGGTDHASNLRLEHLVCNQSAGRARDRARIVNASSMQNRGPDSADSVQGAIFQRADLPPADPAAARNGASNPERYRTIVRYPLEP